MLANHSTSIVNSNSRVGGGTTNVRVEARWHVMNDNENTSCCEKNPNYITYTPYTLELEPVFSKQEYDRMFSALQGDKNNRTCLCQGCCWYCCPCQILTLCIPFTIINQRSAKAARERFLAAVDNISKFLADKGVKNTKEVSSTGLYSISGAPECECCHCGLRSEYYVLWEIAVPNQIVQQPQQQQPVVYMVMAPGMTGTGKPGEMMQMMPQGAMPMMMPPGAMPMMTQEVPPGYTQS